MKTIKIVCAPIATLTLIGSLIGEAEGAITLNPDFAPLISTGFPDVEFGEAGGFSVTENDSGYTTGLIQWYGASTSTLNAGNLLLRLTTSPAGGTEVSPLLEVISGNPEWSASALPSYNNTSSYFTGNIISGTEVSPRQWEFLIPGSIGDTITMRAVTANPAINGEGWLSSPNNVFLTTQVPEPSSSLFIGLSSLILLRRSRK